MKPKISIIVPIYNSEEYLAQLLKSILNQTFTKFEVILINDGSTDSTLEIATAYQKLDSRIKVITQSNSGPSVARNKGITEALGEYILFIDSDDFVEETYVEKLYMMMNQSNIDLGCCGYVDSSKYGKVRLNHFWAGTPILEKNQFLSCVFNGVGGVLWGKIFRRDYIVEYNLRMNPNIHMCEDLIFVLEYSKYIKQVGVINEYLYYYNRLNENSISSNISAQYLENYILVIQQVDMLLQHLDYNINLRVKIIERKVRDIVYGINWGECCEFLKIFNLRNTLSNIKRVNNHPVIINHVNSFPQDNHFTQMMNCLIRKNKYILIFCLNILLIYLYRIKDKVLRRV